MPPKKSATTKVKAAASTTKSTVKASTGKAKTNAKVTTASRTQIVKRAAVDDEEYAETDNDKDEDQDDATEVDDEMAEPKAKAQPASKVRDTDAKAINTAPASQRITTRAANANQHPGQQHKALDKKRRTKEEMIEVRRLAAKQKEEKEKAAKQKKAMQDKAIERVAQYEMKLADDGFNDTPLPRLRRIAGKSNLQFADHGESDEDDVSGPDQPGSDVIDDNDVVEVDDDDMYLSDEVPAKTLKRKGRTAKTNVDDVMVLETSASESEDRPKKKARGKLVESESEVEVVEDSGPQPPPGKPPGRKNLKAKTPIRDAIKDKISGPSDKNMGPDKAKSSDALGKLKPARYVFLT